MKTKNKTFIYVPLLLLLFSLLIAVVVINFGITTASAATTATQTFTGTEEINNNYYGIQSDYNESRAFNTGIKFYGESSSSSGSTTNTNSVSLDKNSFYVDFTGAKDLYIPNDAYAYIDTEYNFAIINSANKVVFSAAIHGEFVLDSNWEYCDYYRQIYFNGNYVSEESTMFEDTLHFYPGELGKRHANLGDGEYTIKITRTYLWTPNYFDNFYFHSSDYYEANSTLTGKLVICSSVPTVSITGTSGNNISSGSSTNQRVTFTANSDFFSRLYYKTPSSSSYSSTTNKTYTIGTTNGWYYAYAEDSFGKTSNTVSIYYDGTGPVGTLYGGTTSKSSGSYVNSNYIKYTASDVHSNMGNYYVKMPGSSSYVSYTSGNQLVDEGTYYFYSTDSVGNQSSVVNITLDKTSPVGTLYAGTTVKSSGSYVNSNYVKYTATDTSGIANYYVKNPGNSSYTSYTSGTQLTTEGEYSFYSVDRAGNASATVTITLDRTAPVGTITSNGSTVTSGAKISKSFAYTATDSGGGIGAVYYKTPINPSYQTYTSGSIIAASSGDGLYQFYAVDKSGNQSATASVYLDTTKPALSMSGYSSGNSIANGASVNERVTISASDTNFYRIYYKSPSTSSYTYTTSSSYTSGTANGVYYVYAEDAAGNTSDVYSFHYDTVKPVGNIVCKEQNVVNGGYVANSFSYNASDSGSGVASLFYKTPSSSNYKAYYSGMLIPVDLGDGWYYFYSVDNAGNQSDITSVFLETQIPLVKIYRNGELRYSKSMSGDGTYDTDIYLNPNDKLKITCDTSSGHVTSNYELDTNNIIGSSYTGGSYTVTIASATGITGNFIYHIVHSKPTIEIDGVTYHSGSLIYFNSDKTVTFVDDSVITNSGNTGATLTSEGDIILNEYIPYASSISKTLTTSNETDTKYIIMLNDRAGNESRFTVFIDKLPPVGVWEADRAALPNNGYTNKTLAFIITEAGVTAIYSYNGGEYKAYTSGQIFTADGTYNIILTDQANNRSMFTAHIDTIAPIGQLYADNNPVEDGIITSQNIFFSWDGDMSATVNGEPYTKNSTLSEDMVYHFVLTDFAGNYTEYTATIDTVAPAYNAEKLNNSQQLISKWYLVTVSEQGYSFATYDQALKFACNYEFNSNVTALILNRVEDFTQHHLVADGSEIHAGEYWLYKSKANPDSILYYFDRAVLDDAVAYYAQNTISVVNYFNPETDNIYGTPAGSMNDNIFSAPDGTAAPALNGFIFDRVDGCKLYAELVGGDGSRVELEYGIPFEEQVKEGGLYKIIELDDAENCIEFYGFMDILPPELNVSVTIIGNTEATELTITPSSLTGGVAYYYESFNVNAVIDADKWSVLAIENNGKTSYYTYGALLPCLNVGGEYMVSVYDRLGHGYSFPVYIIGNPATITVENNADDTAIGITITLEQKFDTLVSLEIKRNDALLDGVSTNKLSYTFDKAGTYTIALRDNFGRVIKKEYVFVKALPEGTLEGVVDGEKTKSDVLFTFDSSKYYASVTKDGTLYTEDFTGEIRFEATDANSGSYVIRLIRISDIENYKEYSFAINTIAPNFGISVADKTTTNKNVTVTWTETDIVSITYALNNCEAIELKNGEVLAEEGVYIITATNDLGTQSHKTFTIDKTLEYDVLINDTETIGVDATNKNVTVINHEPLNVDVTKNGMKYDFTFGQLLTDEGNYGFRISDEYGNTAAFFVLIDKTVDISATIGNGVITNDDVVIIAGEKVNTMLTKDGEEYAYTLGSTLTEEGLYRMTAYDLNGNEKILSFQIVRGIKTKLDYTLGENVVITSVMRDGESVVADGRRLNFTIDGTYSIVCVSDGKEYSFNLSLDTTAPTIELHGVSNGGSSGKPVTIDNLSEEGTVEVYKDGELIEYELGEKLSEYGSYRVVVSDAIGNTNEYSFTLKYKMDGGIIALIVICVLAAAGGGVFLFIKKRRRS